MAVHRASANTNWAHILFPFVYVYIGSHTLDAKNNYFHHRSSVCGLVDARALPAPTVAIAGSNAGIGSPA